MQARPPSSTTVAASDLRDRVDATLAAFLDVCAVELEAIDARATILIEEVRRLVRAGGKRLRPAFCFWGYRAAGGQDGTPILRAASSLELLHTMALIHDDLMDQASERRGVAASTEWFGALAVERGLPADPERFGPAAALLTGDLAAVLADRLMLESGFEADDLMRAQAPYHAMRIQMATGQLLDVSGLAARPAEARRAARLKGGAYTVEGPLRVGAALAGAGQEILTPLLGYGRALGEAFQLRDDLEDDEAAVDLTPSVVNDLIAEAREALSGSAVSDDAARELDALAAGMVMA